MAMVPQGQEEEGLRELTLEELAGHHLVLSKRHRKYVLSIFEKHGLSCDVYYECEDARTAMSLAASGLGTAILPASMRGQSEKICPIPIAEKELITDVLLVWRNEEHSDVVESFIREFYVPLHGKLWYDENNVSGHIVVTVTHCLFSNNKQE